MCNSGITHLTPKLTNRGARLSLISGTYPDTAMENEYARFEVREGLVFVASKQGILLDFDAARHIGDAVQRLQPNKPMPVVFDFSGIADSDKAGRDCLSRVWARIPALGLFADGRIAFAIAHFAVAVNKPNTRAAVFLRERDAINFVKE
jgi:hypothetical protein